MAKKGSKTKGKEGQSLRYQATSLANRRTRIERHMKNHPTDAQAKVASVSYTHLTLPTILRV